MNTVILAAIGCSLMFLLPAGAYAISAQWDLDPISGDWNMAANWTPIGVPNGPTDTATFALSHTTNVSISANTEVNAITFTPTATNPYSVTASPGLTLIISGAVSGNALFQGGFTAFSDSSTAGNGIFTNNGGTGGVGGQTLFFDTSTGGNGIFINNAGTPNGAGGYTEFFNSSSAGNGTFTNNGGQGFSGFTRFSDTSSAGNGTFTNTAGTISNLINGGRTSFTDNATAANGTFTNKGGTVSGAGYGSTGFGDSSTADSATFINNAGTVSGAHGGVTIFGQTATAANGTFTNNGATVSGAAGGHTEFYYSSTAGHGSLTNNGGTVSGAVGGSTIFNGSSTAASAILVANGGSNGGGGGTILFADQSTVGTARIEVFGNGSLDISLHDAPGMTIDSIEGDGKVFLGANKSNYRQRQYGHDVFLCDSGWWPGWRSRRLVDEDRYGNARPHRSQHLHWRHQCQWWRVEGRWIHCQQHGCPPFQHARWHGNNQY